MMVGGQVGGQLKDACVAMLNDPFSGSAWPSARAVEAGAPAAEGAALNVRINARTLADKELASSLVKRAQGLERDAEAREAAILAAVEQRL